MIAVRFTSTTDTREQLKQFQPKTSRCACGNAKQAEHLQCPTCARYVGPYVLVESPSGNYVEAGGLESAQSLIERTIQHSDEGTWLGIKREHYPDKLKVPCKNK